MINGQIAQEPLGYLLLSEDHLILSANDTFLQVIGFTLKGLQGCHFDSILTKASRLFYQIHFFQRIKINNKVEKMNLTLRSASGANVPVLLEASSSELEGDFVIECYMTFL